ncbi:MAG: hypothetical protein IJ370_01800 [Oscillospiraceae bacterium]|nr:hypothetical protein [Oscillospiraceae bacterium]MBQ8337984.1 hypothetical protein [Oscillospiraceae bacterium]
MKKLIAALVPIVLLLLCVGCVGQGNKAVKSLGKYSSKVFYTHGGFQDYVDYAKYTYDDVDLAKKRYFSKITDESKKTLTEHIENYEQWIDTIAASDSEDELVLNYDFDLSIVSQDDYVYIYDDPDYDYLTNYDICLFDSGTSTLYYFHSNI